MSAATRSASSPIRPRRAGHRQLGGQGISVVSYSDNQDEALAVHQMVRAARCAEEVVGARRLFLPQSRAERPELPGQRAVRRGLPDVDGHGGQDFWAEPSYAAAPAGRCRSASMTTWSPTRAPQGSARRAGEGLDRGLQGRRQDLGQRPRAQSVPRHASMARDGDLRHADMRSGRPVVTDTNASDAGSCGRRCGARDARAAGAGACAACPTGPSPGSSSRRRSSCCWRSTSSR